MKRMKTVVRYIAVAIVPVVLTVIFQSAISRKELESGIITDHYLPVQMKINECSTLRSNLYYAIGKWKGTMQLLLDTFEDITRETYVNKEFALAVLNANQSAADELVISRDKYNLCVSEEIKLIETLFRAMDIYDDYLAIIDEVKDDYEKIDERFSRSNTQLMSEYQTFSQNMLTDFRDGVIGDNTMNDQYLKDVKHLSILTSNVLNVLLEGLEFERKYATTSMEKAQSSLF